MLLYCEGRQLQNLLRLKPVGSAPSKDQKLTDTDDIKIWGKKLSSILPYYQTTILVKNQPENLEHSKINCNLS